MITIKLKKRILPLQLMAAAGACVAATADVAAQSTSASGAQASGALEEVVVTARRREESLQNIPIAVTALSADQLADLQISNFGEVGVTVPNLSVETQFGSGSAPLFTLRGQATGSTKFQVDSRVGLYIDDVYLGRAIASAFDLASTCQLEVLRGPQGTLFGRNSTGGAINFRSCAPAEEFEGQVEVTAGDYDLTRVRATVDTGEYNGFSARLTYLNSSNDGYVDNRVGGTTKVLSAPVGEIEAADSFGEEDSEAIGLALRYTGIDGLQLDYRFDYTDKENSQLGVQLLGFVDPGTAGLFAASGGIPASTKRLDSLPLDFTGTGELEVSGHAFTLQYELSDSLAIKNILSYREFEEHTGGNDIDGNALDGAALGAPGVPFAYISSLNVRDQEQVSNEFQLIGTHEKLDWLLGLFYFKEEGDSYGPVFIGGLWLPPEPIQVGNVSTFVPNDFFAGGEEAVENESRAIYGSLNYHLTEAWTLSGGVRYTKDDREEVIKQVAFIPPGSKFDADFSYVDWDVSATYQWNDDTSLYGKVATAHLSGGVLGGVSFDEEKIINYELGIKSDWLDKRVRLNAAVFHAKVDDLQTSEFSPSTGTIIINSGESTQDGIELELTALLWEGLTLNATYGYLNDDKEGDLRYLYPESNAYLGLQYDFPSTRWGLWSARLDASWEDESYGLACPVGASVGEGGNCINLDQVNRQLDRAITKGANTQLSARLTLAEIPLGGNGVQGRISLWGKNLLDTDELEFPRSLGNGTIVGTFQIPRTWGVDLSVSF
ncbi:TonB-dependent receptor [Parahaliea mediterranea]|uniref:TonB-dependent receptor n=1 Tax=Parahaliea mediterranea TaxID=651086 RepID=UPI0014756634|nr:TonB-dependent receptor [Parahaliea mediterranea]